MHILPVDFGADAELMLDIADIDTLDDMTGKTIGVERKLVIPLIDT